MQLALERLESFTPDVAVVERLVAVLASSHLTRGASAAITHEQAFVEARRLLELADLLGEFCAGGSDDARPVVRSQVLEAAFARPEIMAQAQPDGPLALVHRITDFHRRGIEAFDACVKLAADAGCMKASFLRRLSTATRLEWSCIGAEAASTCVFSVLSGRMLGGGDVRLALFPFERPRPGRRPPRTPWTIERAFLPWVRHIYIFRFFHKMINAKSAAALDRCAETRRNSARLSAQFAEESAPRFHELLLRVTATALQTARSLAQATAAPADMRAPPVPALKKLDATLDSHFPSLEQTA